MSVTATAAPAPAAVKPVKFASEADLLDYMRSHSMTLTGVAVNLFIPNVFEMLAKYFDNREIPLDKLKNHVKIAVDAMIDDIINKHNALAPILEAEGINTSLLFERQYPFLTNRDPEDFQEILDQCELLMEDCLIR